MDQGVTLLTFSLNRMVLAVGTMIRCMDKDRTRLDSNIFFKYYVVCIIIIMPNQFFVVIITFLSHIKKSVIVTISNNLISNLK